MLKYLTKKALYLLSVLLGVVGIVFLIFNLLPGDPARMLLGQRADAASVEAINKELGLNQPKSTQFLLYLNDLSPISFHDTSKASLVYYDSTKYDAAAALRIGNSAKIVLKTPYLRRSYQSQKKVTTILKETLPSTLLLAFLALILATTLGIGIGIIAGVNKGTWIDRLSLAVVVIGVSGPSFFISILLAWIFGFLLKDYTGLNMTGSLYDVDPFTGSFLNLKNAILPAIALGIRPLAIIVQLTRNELIEVLGQDYIRTARAKGLPEKAVLIKHALRNTLTPLLTAISGWLSGALAGAVFVEYVYAWNGIGKEVVDALEKYDFPVLMGVILVFATLFVVINFIVDILYTWIDPRVKASMK